MLSAILRQFGTDKARFWFERWPEPYTFCFEIKPKNVKAAVIIGVIDQQGEIDLTIDSVTTILESNREYGSAEQLERLREICEAVMAGRYLEEVYSVGSTRIGITGIVRLPNREIRLRNVTRLSLKWLSPKKQATVLTFDPY